MIQLSLVSLENAAIRHSEGLLYKRLRNRPPSGSPCPHIGAPPGNLFVGVAHHGPATPWTPAVGGLMGPPLRGSGCSMRERGWFAARVTRRGGCAPCARGVPGLPG